jgi:hypothetical protein
LYQDPNPAETLKGMSFEIAECYLPESMKPYYMSIRNIYNDPRKSIVRNEVLKHAEEVDAG